MEVSSRDISRARRSAQKLRNWAPCISCKAYGKKCSQFRPCSRCLKMGKPCFKLESATTMDFYLKQTAVIPEERLLNFLPKLTIGDEPMPVVQLAPEMLWASIELMKNMAIGHEVDSLAHFFASLTSHDSSALAFAINSAAALGRSTAPLAPDILKASQNLRDADDGEHSQYWSMETGTASFRTAFDPMSRRRQAIIANARQASFYGS